MLLKQAIRSASFKLTLAYVGLFASSLAVLAVITYGLISAQMMRDFYSHIANESKALVTEFRSGGVPRLLQAIEVRQRVYMADGLDYTLFDASGRRMFGKMPAIPCTSGWHEVTGPPDGDEPPGEKERLGVIVSPLSGGLCLMVGDDLGAIDRFEGVIIKRFGWIFAISITLAILGGILLSTNFMRRIEVINKTAEAIIGGDLKRRIPRRGAPDDLDRLTATLNRMLDRICGLMESHRQLSNNVAHDLRTPLGRLRRLLDEARDAEYSSAGYQAVIDQGVKEIDGVLDTFGAILRLSQIETGSRRGGFTECDLTFLVSDVADTFALALEEGGRSVAQDIDPGINVIGDPELITLAIANLLENCMIHTPPGTNVLISLSGDAHQAHVQISDNGPGIPDSDHEKIFDRFFRVDGSRSAFGNGLGLSIVAAIAALHGGKVVASSGRPGLRIDFTLPRTAQARG